MSKDPMVDCPKEDRMVPIWWCLGSFVQQRMACPELLEATVNIVENYATVKCKAQKEEKRGFTIQGHRHRLTLTELRTRLNGTPTKHVLAVWAEGE